MGLGLFLEERATSKSMKIRPDLDPVFLTQRKGNKEGCGYAPVRERQAKMRSLRQMDEKVMNEFITPEHIRQKLAWLEAQPQTADSQFWLQLLREYLSLTADRAAIRLPVCSSSPVCEIEAGYAAGVSDCREAIRRAGYPIAGDE